MRGLVGDLATPYPIGLQLPGVFQDDHLLQRFVTAFDDALAPVLTTLDNLPAYVDPRLAPGDFAGWLAGWVGVAFDDAATLEQRRRVVAGAVAVHRGRGTVRGVVDAVRLVLGVEAEVVESGGARWSSRPGASLPGEPVASLLVRVRVPDPSTVDRRRLDAAVAAAKPAHVPHTVEVVGGAGTSGPDGGDG